MLVWADVITPTAAIAMPLRKKLSALAPSLARNSGSVEILATVVTASSTWTTVFPSGRPFAGIGGGRRGWRSAATSSTNEGSRAGFILKPNKQRKNYCRIGAKMSPIETRLCQDMYAVKLIQTRSACQAQWGNAPFGYYRLEPERCIAPEWRFSTMIEQGTTDVCTRESKVDYV
jgi:hypothetical protein